VTVTSIKAYIGFADLYGGQSFNVTHGVFNAFGTQVWYAGYLSRTPIMTSSLSKNAGYLSSMGVADGTTFSGHTCPTYNINYIHTFTPVNYGRNEAYKVFLPSNIKFTKSRVS
jgi:hypothetical protein